MEGLLEVCCADPQSVVAAFEGGADRIELCSSLETGGLTPSGALIDFAVKLFPGKVNVLIRPRSGDFLYTPQEMEVIIADIEDAVKRNVAGIVSGALTPEGELDIVALQMMLEATGGASFTLHRAFDLCKNPEKALEQAVALGIDRILTSGLSTDVVTGKDQLLKLRKQAAGRLIILAGGGVNANNIKNLKIFTGIKEFHASCKFSDKSKMVFQRENVSMSAPGNNEFSRLVTSKHLVQELAKIVHSL